VYVRENLGEMAKEKMKLIFTMIMRGMNPVYLGLG
jgi:hypothetical protein